MFGIWNIGIPKGTLELLISKMDADEDGFITVGEVRDLLKRSAKDATKSCKSTILRRS